MSDGIDFSDCKRNLNTYGGANGNKIGIIYNGENYMLKFPSNIKNLTKQKIKGEYTNSCVNEYVGSHIFQSLGIEAQETLLGTYQDKIILCSLRIFAISLVSGISWGIFVFISLAGIVQSPFSKSIYSHFAPKVFDGRFMLKICK